MSAGASTAERDFRLDFFRGIALFSIFIDHVDRDSIVAQFTLQSVGFSDAAEVFILISGYTAGMVYGRIIERRGLLRAGVRIYHRVWQLYVAHVFLFMQFMATVAYMVDDLNNSIYAEEFRAADFLKEPGAAVIKALTLQFQPAFMDILPLYIVLLAALPFVFVGFRLWPAGVLAASLRTLGRGATQQEYCAGSLSRPSTRCGSSTRSAGRPSSSWAPGCGWRGTRGGIPWLTNRWLFRLAVAGALAGFLVRFSWTLHWLYDPFPALFGKALWPLLSKTNLSLLQFANDLILALLAARLIPPQAAFLTSRAAWPCVLCGRHSLHVFCLGIMLRRLASYINEFLGGVLLQCVVAVVGIAIMIRRCRLMDWVQGRAESVGSAGAAGSATDRGV